MMKSHRHFRFDWFDIGLDLDKIERGWSARRGHGHRHYARVFWIG